MKLVFFFTLIIAWNISKSQIAPDPSSSDSLKLSTFVDSILQTLYNRSHEDLDSIDNASLNSPVYRLYKTTNMWTFIKLNTRDGRMWQVQFDIGEENRFESSLNIITLVSKQGEYNGRFTLQPTDNMWNFLLLDQYNGKVWQVQWSQESENRMIIPIKRE